MIVWILEPLEKFIYKWNNYLENYFSIFFFIAWMNNYCHRPSYVHFTGRISSLVIDNLHLLQNLCVEKNIVYAM